ncbi:MAG: hypothetical protein AAFR58_17640 [Cyanobacteria bacterium J06627_28]
MPNPTPVQSDLFKHNRFQRTVGAHSSIPADVPLARNAIAVKLPAKVDEAIRELGEQKAAWLREVICQAAIQEGLVEEL